MTFLITNYKFNTFANLRLSFFALLTADRVIDEVDLVEEIMTKEFQSLDQVNFESESELVR